MTLIKNNKIIKYRFQPEPATSIIYWSVTFASFFVGLIAVLEQFSITWFNLLFFSIFLGLTYVGCRRHFLIFDDELYVGHILKRNRNKIEIAQIDKVAVGTYGLTFYGSGWGQCPLEERVFLMRPRTMDRFVTALEHELAFQGEIVSIKKSVGLD